MGYKKDDPCLNKAFEDERLFVLMARDNTAPEVVVEWIKLNVGKQPAAKLHEALDCAIEMYNKSDDIIERLKQGITSEDKLSAESYIAAVQSNTVVDCDKKEEQSKTKISELPHNVNLDGDVIKEPLNYREELTAQLIGTKETEHVRFDESELKLMTCCFKYSCPDQCGDYSGGCVLKQEYCRVHKIKVDE